MKKIYVYLAASLGLALTGLLNTAAHAQDSARVLNNVVVTASRSPQKMSDIGRDLTVITSKEIEQAQGQTLPQLLNNVAGITFPGANNAPGIATSIFLRGASTGNTLILVDGFPVNNASAIDNSYDLNAFPLDQVDHIEILKGSGSTLYGSDAVAGVINIITKHAAKQGLTGNVQLSGGSYNTFKEATGLSGRLNKTGIAINASNTDSKGFPAVSDTTGVGRINNDFHSKSVSANISQQVSNKFILNGNLQLTRNNGHLPYGAFEADKNYTYGNTFLFGGIGGKLLLQKGSLNVNISQNDVWNHYADKPFVTNYDTPYADNNTGRITDAEAVFNYSLVQNLDITAGTAFKYLNTNQVSSYDTIHSGIAHNSIGSLYASLFYKAGIFHLELGGRYNRDSKYGHNFTYTVNPSVLLFKSLKLYATVASAYKAPSLYQLDSQYGFAGLRPQTTNSYEAGLNLTLIRNILSFNTAFYKYNTSNVIYFKGLAAAPYGIYANGEHQSNKGFENELKLTTDKLTANAYWAYVSGKLTDENGATIAYLFRQPKNTLGVNVYYNFSEKFSAGLNYKYTGDRPDEEFNPVTYAPVIVSLNHYSLLGAHLQYAANKRISLFADLNNLFDVKYTDWAGYNTMRFNFMAGLKYQIN